MAVYRAVLNTIANVKLRDQLRDQSIRDTLTGLFNRRYMLETCRREFVRAARIGQPVSLLSIDVDQFKKYTITTGTMLEIRFCVPSGAAWRASSGMRMSHVDLVVRNSSSSYLAPKLVQPRVEPSNYAPK
jgi:predicted signal transduction protein with EAL and GGDEF domain